MPAGRSAPAVSADLEIVLSALGPLPAERHAPPHLFVTVGLPGVGKSTFVRRLAPAVGAAVLESDVLRKRLFGIPVHSNPESARLFRAIQGATRLLLRDGINVVIDATNLSEHDRRPDYVIAKETGAVLHVMHFVAPEPIVRERLRQRLLTAEDAFVADEDVYEALRRTYDPISVLHTRIVTSDPAATDAALTLLINAVRPLTPAGAGGIA